MPGSPGSNEPAARTSDNSPSGEAGQREAAETLKKAGEKIADAAKNGAAGGESGDSATNGVDDPFIPNGDRDSNDYHEGNLADSSMPTLAGDMQGESSSQGDLSAEDDMSGGETAPAQGSAESGGMTPEQQAAVEAAQEALEQAGIALQTAGGTLEGARTDEELAAAEADLAKARVSVIIAGQDLLDLRKIFEGTVNEDIFAEAEDSLNDANGAIVVATESIFSSRIQLPDFSIPSTTQGSAGEPGNMNLPGSTGLPGSASPSGSSRQSGNGGLDDELNESIAIFEGKIIEARNVILDGTPAPTSNDNIPGVLVLGGGSGNDRETTLKENEDGDLDTNIPEVLQPGVMPNEGREVASSGLPASPNPIPEDVPDAQGDDIVAKQLREAAISEPDPQLSAKLWDEYRKYKAGL